MAMTMTQKILAAHAGLESVKAGQLIEANLDLVLGNDITSPVAVKDIPCLLDDSKVHPFIVKLSTVVFIGGANVCMQSPQQSYILVFSMVILFEAVIIIPAGNSGL